MSDKRINHPGQTGFVPPGASLPRAKPHLSPHIGVCRVHINSMFRLAETPLTLQSFNHPKLLPLQTRANTRTQKSQLATEAASSSQRQQGASGTQANSATNSDAELDDLDNEEASGSKKSAATDGASSGGMSAAKKPTQFAIKAPDQTSSSGSMFRATVNLREQQAELEQTLARSKLPGVELLTKAPGPDVTRASLLPTFALGLLTAANLPVKAGLMPSRVAATMMMTRAFIQAVPAHEQGRISLDEVKTCVISAAAKNPPPARAAGTPDEGLENSLVLLPLAILHACRKRTLEEQPMAANRIGMMISSKAVG
jgi:hypothetical protein